MPDEIPVVVERTHGPVGERRRALVGGTNTLDGGIGTILLEATKVNVAPSIPMAHPHMVKRSRFHRTDLCSVISTGSCDC